MSKVVLFSTPMAQWPEAIAQFQLPHVRLDDDYASIRIPPGEIVCWMGYTSPLDCLDYALRAQGFCDFTALLDRWQRSAEDFLRQRQRLPERVHLVNLALLSPAMIEHLLNSFGSDSARVGSFTIGLPRIRPVMHPSALASLVISERSDLVALYAALEAEAELGDREPQSQLPLSTFSEGALAISLLQEWELQQHRLQKSVRSSSEQGLVGTFHHEDQDNTLERRQRVLRSLESTDAAVDAVVQGSTSDQQICLLLEEHERAIQSLQSQLQQQARRAAEANSELDLALDHKKLLQSQLLGRDVELQKADQSIQELQARSDSLEAEVARLSGCVVELEFGKREAEEEVNRVRLELEDRVRKQEELEGHLRDVERRHGEAMVQSQSDLQQLMEQRDVLLEESQRSAGELEEARRRGVELECGKREAEEEVNRVRLELEDRVRKQEELEGHLRDVERRHGEAMVQSQSDLQQLMEQRDVLLEESQRSAGELEEVRRRGVELECGKREAEEEVNRVRLELEDRVRKQEELEGHLRDVERRHGEAMVQSQLELQDLMEQRDVLLEESQRSAAELEEARRRGVELECGRREAEEEVNRVRLELEDRVRKQEELEGHLRDVERRHGEAMVQSQLEMQELIEQRDGLTTFRDGLAHVRQSLEEDLQDSEQEKELLHLQLNEVQEVLTNTFQSLQQCQESGRQREANIQELQLQRDELTRDLQELAEECRHLFQHSSFQGDLDRSRIRCILQLVRESMQA